MDSSKIISNPMSSSNSRKINQ